MKLPTLTVRNAIAFVDAYGDHFSHTHASVRLDAERNGVVFDMQGGVGTGKPLTFYRVTDEGRAIAATGTLAPCLAYAKEHGFEIETVRRRRARKPKPGYIPLINRETGEEAYISRGRYLYRKADGQGWRFELAFEGKPSRLAK
jgi:hypothetical protein